MKMTKALSLLFAVQLFLISPAVPLSAADEDRAAGKCLFPVNKDGKYGFIDGSGEMKIEYRFDDARYFCENLGPVEIDYKWGYIDREGTMVIKPEFDFASEFVSGTAIAYRDGSFGYINTEGDFVIEPVYYNAADFSEGFARVEKAGEIHFFIDKSGKNRFKKTFGRVTDFSGGAAGVYDSEKDAYGYIDTEGKVTYVENLRNVPEFSEGLAAVDIGGKWGYMDSGGEIVIEPEYSNASPFGEGFGVVRQNGTCLIIDKEGGKKASYECGWTPLAQVADGLTIFERGGKNGYVDTDGNIVVEPKYDLVSPFRDGVAFVVILDENEYGYINKKGKYVWKNSP